MRKRIVKVKSKLAAKKLLVSLFGAPIIAFIIAILAPGQAYADDIQLDQGGTDQNSNSQSQDASSGGGPQAGSEGVTQTPNTDPAPDVATSVSTVQVKIEEASTTLQTAAQTKSNEIITHAIESGIATDTQSAITAVQSNPTAASSISSVAPVIQEANQAISTAQSSLQDAVNGQATVASATEVVASSQASVDSATAVVVSTQQTLATEEAKLPELQATESTACTNFYTENGNLGTATSNVATAQQVADAAIIANQVAEDALNTHTPIVIAAQEANAVARDANDVAQGDLTIATQAVTTQQVVVSTNAQAVATAQAAATASASPGLNETVYQSYQGGGQPSVGYGSVRTTTIDTNGINEQWGSGGPVSGLNDRFQVKWDGNITSTTDSVIRFYAPADDGVRLYIDNTIIINDWVDKGGGGSQSGPVTFTANVPKPITLWFYENGGGANVVLQWYKSNSSGYVTVPASAFTRGTMDPALAAAVTSAQGTLQVSQATLDSLLAAQSTAQTNASTAYQTYIDANQAMAQAEAVQAPIQQAAWDTRAAVVTTQQNLTTAQVSYNSQLAIRDTAYQVWQDAIHATDAQEAVIASAQAAYEAAQSTLTSAQSTLTSAQSTLTSAQENATTLIAGADHQADVAIAAVGQAVIAMTNSVSTVNAAIDAQVAAEAARQAAIAEAARVEAARVAAEQAAAAEAQAAANAKAEADAAQAAADAAQAASAAAAAQAAADAQAAQDAAAEQAAAEAQAAADAQAAQDAAAEQAAAEAQAAADAQAQADAQAEADAQAQAEADAQAQADAEAQAQIDAKAEAEAQAQEEVKAILDAVVTEETTAETWKPAVDPETYMTKDEIKSFTEIGIIPNNPNQLPTDVPKEAPKELLVEHVQIDVAGVENGGIQFFGTKTSPQVVNEDGTLTPPAPPPGSGLPIPPDAITTTETFIGQPGGTSFNAPDIAVPVLVSYVCKTVTNVDGKEVHIDLDGVEHPIDRCTFLPAALDSIPGAGVAVQALGAAYANMANIGNDMSPVTRKKAKKILVTTIVVGQIVALRRRFGA